MKIIDLINKQNSDIVYNIITFPDGEIHIKFTEEINRKEDYVIKCRVTNANELFILLQVGNILNNNQVEFAIDIYYLMSMRMDRIISFNEAYSLKLVADLINSLNASSVRIFHAHSDKTLKLINNAVDMEQFYNKTVMPDINKYDTICFPDAGAYKRYQNQINFFGKNTIVLKKRRNLDTGAIEGIEIDKENSSIYYDIKNILVTDDLCDAGGTFLGAHKVLTDNFNCDNIDIFVRHMVNPIGIDNLCKTYNNVYFTQSYNDWGNGYSNINYIDI